LFLAAAKQRLDRTVMAVTHPAFDAALKRSDFGKSAVADALHPPANDNVSMHGQANSPR
jgi:hypothetical protein